MMYKLVGSALIMLACGGFGFFMAASHRRETRLLRSLIAALSYMKCELQFHNTTLPTLCRKTADFSSDSVGRYFLELSRELESQICPDIQWCSVHALSKISEFPISVCDSIQTLAGTLGSFNLEGQLEGLEHASRQAEQALEKLLVGQDQRLRNYQTLGLCAGAALAILLV